MSLQKTATVVSSIVAFTLMIIKFTIGIISGSIAVLSSAIDSLLDMFVSIFNYIAVHNSEKNPDKKFNYGRGKIEAMASLFEGIIITLSGLYIIYESINKIINNESVSYVGITVIVMIISVIFTGGLVYFLGIVAKKTDNLVIKSDSLHYKTDLYTNVGILAGLAIIHFTGFYLVDSLIGLGIGIYIIYSASELVRKGFLLLLDISLSNDEVNKIKEIINSEKMVKSYHELRTRKSGNIKFVQVHLVFNHDIKLIDAHRVSDHVEHKIAKLDDKYERKVLVHMDPYDDDLGY